MISDIKGYKYNKYKSLEELLTKGPPTKDDCYFYHKTKDIPKTPHCMRLSELYFIYTLISQFGCKQVIESGTYMGYSAGVLSRLLTLPLQTIDLFLTPQADKLRKTNKFVHFLKGNSLEIIPILLEYNNKRPVGVVIDGPKRELAIELAVSCLQFPNVLFCTIHDVDTDAGIQAFADLPHKKLLLSEYDFHKKCAYGWMDEGTEKPSSLGVLFKWQ